MKKLGKLVITDLILVGICAAVGGIAGLIRGGNALDLGYMLRTAYLAAGSILLLMTAFFLIADSVRFHDREQEKKRDRKTNLRSGAVTGEAGVILIIIGILIDLYIRKNLL